MSNNITHVRERGKSKISAGHTLKCLKKNSSLLACMINRFIRKQRERRE